MRHAVIGMGEVGKGVYKVLGNYYPVVCRDKESEIIPHKIAILDICIPYSDTFEAAVKEYIELYKPRVTIVYSTVPIGTCERLGVVHSPVEGKHPAIGLSIQNSPRWFGTSDRNKMVVARQGWFKTRIPIRAMPSANFTEWLKLRSTSKYGINLVWTEYEAAVSKELGMDFSAVKQFDLDYNLLYSKLGMQQFQRYILDPPEGKIGGHCVVPNAELLNKQYPSEMLSMIGRMK